MAFAVRSLLNVSKITSSNKILLINPVTKGSLYRFNVQNTRTLTRSLSVLSRRRVSDCLMPSTTKALLSNACSCGCSLHTKGDKELSAFLDEEIENEMKSQPGELPKLEGFECQLDGAEVTLKKKWNNEIISIKSNVNNSVDADETVMDPNETKEPQESEMKAKPEFTIEIEKGGKVLSFLCTYTTAMPDEGPSENYNDTFQISEISLYEGEFEDSTYTVSGDIMDGYLYDLLMNYLEERGISNDFAEKLMTFFTLYEHKLYVKLLRGMKSFVEK